MWICIAPCRDHTSKVLRYGMHSQKSHSFTCTPPPHFHPQQNEPYLPLPSQPKLVLIYRPRRDGRLSWPWVAGWLHTEIRVWHRELNPDTVAHLSTNWAWHWLTSLIEANTLTTTLDQHHEMAALAGMSFDMLYMCPHWCSRHSQMTSSSFRCCVFSLTL